MGHTASIKELLSQADALISASASPSLSKIASSDEVSAVLKELGHTEEVPIEKIAVVLNRVMIASYLEGTHKVDLFEKTAKENGATPEMIADAFLKIAADKTKKNLPAFIASQFTVGGTTAANNSIVPESVAKPTAKVVKGFLKRRPMTQNEGY